MGGLWLSVTPLMFAARRASSRSWLLRRKQPLAVRCLPQPSPTPPLTGCFPSQMAPKKQVDQVEARHGCELAVKQEVSIVDIISFIKEMDKFKGGPYIADLDRFIEKYKSKTLTAAAINQLLRVKVGAFAVKEACETLVPGFTSSWAPMPHEHPIIV